MSLPKHLTEAAQRIEAASRQIDAARAKPASPESLREWLLALTDYVAALSEVQQLSTQSIHEKLHALAGRAGVSGVL